MLNYVNICQQTSKDISDIFLPSINKKIDNYVALRRDSLLRNPFARLDAFDPIAAASIEILIHSLLSKGPNFDHGDEASKNICWYIEKCIYQGLLDAKDQEEKLEVSVKFYDFGLISFINTTMIIISY